MTDRYDATFFDNDDVLVGTERGLVSAREADMDCAVIPNALTAGADFSRVTVQLDSMAELPGWLVLC